MQEYPTLGIIGGSGLYAMSGLRENRGKGPFNPHFGKPSAPIIVGTMKGSAWLSWPGTALGHHISPAEVADVYALKSLGVERIVGVSACGSLRRRVHPGRNRDPRPGLRPSAREHKRRALKGALVVHFSAL